MKRFPKDHRARLLAVVVVSAVLGGTSSAHASAAKDPDDVAGRLDIKRISAPSDDDSGPIWHHVQTFGRWKSRVLARRSTEVDLWFSLDDDPDPERVVYIGYERDDLVATMHTYRVDGDSTGVGELGSIDVKRETRRSVAVHVPRKWLRKSDYRWSTSTYFWRKAGKRCTRERACADDAPDDHWLQGQA